MIGPADIVRKQLRSARHIKLKILNSLTLFLNAIMSKILTSSVNNSSSTICCTNELRVVKVPAQYETGIFLITSSATIKSGIGTTS